MRRAQISAKSHFANVIRLVSLLWAYPFRTLGGLLAIVVSNSIQLSIPWLTKVVVDQLQNDQIDRAGLIQTAWHFLFLTMACFLAKQVWRHLLLGAARQIEADLRRELLEQTMRLTPRAAEGTDAGKYMALASNDIPAIGQALAFGLIACFDSVFIAGVAIFLMLQISTELTLLAVLPLPILLSLMLASLRLIYQRFDKVQDSLEKLTEKTRESLSGMRTLKAYDQAEGDAKHFHKFNASYYRRMMAYVRIDAIFPPLILLFGGSSTALILYFGGPLVLQGKLSLGGLAAFFGYLALLTWPMIAAGWMLVLLQRGAASIGRLDEILTAEVEDSRTSAFSFESHLEVRGLNYSYPNGTRALADWNFSAKLGTTVGIVGPIGSGKTTFLALLSRLLEAPPNSIFLDGIDISTLPPDAVREKIAYVNQEPFLFSESIAENLLLASPMASDQELKRAVELGCLEDDIREFPDGLDTTLGERGVTLSGGQKQRAALARAILKQAPILLLDDTLSAVDTVTEQRLLKTLRRISEQQSRLIIIVSHRLSAVEACEQILVCQNGKIVASGTHKALLETSQLYSELHSLQQHRNHHD